MAKRLNAQQRVGMTRLAKDLAGQGVSQRGIAAQLGVSQPTVCQWLRSEELGTVQQQTAAKIRAELVCCDIFARIEALYGDLEAQAKLHESKAYHSICYYGEWAARIAEEMQ